ncbi:hydroxymethylglutaryl-CoA synthase [Balneatrix alpica]|uniref:Hydroxymethylglutaryl-CoA synthase n=1 Tax=Balneatrix alpica TaxID=75684 RepID=A0ABV5ZDW9_9GAMM|nr:hydroxymethylglutaryl-CoA synthase [Balneatrix alpica]
MKVGIDDISFYTSNYYLDLRTLAEVHNIDVEKYYVGIGQEQMGMPAPDEDVVTMGAAAALPIVRQLEQPESISTLLFATESGIDQSKSAGVFAHQLLGLPATCRVVELKQACYSATAAIQMACALVARQPQQRVLVIASDIARYDLDSSGEPTQGCGAVALLIAANPRLVEIEPLSGLHTEDVMDFWRPNYRSTALVDGKYSTKIYLKSLKSAWQHYRQQGGRSLREFAFFCYHLPFTRMAQKAHAHLLKLESAELTAAEAEAQITDTLQYNKRIGNSYTASMYIGLASLLENAREDISEKLIGFFSYGSGCVAEFYAGRVVPGYQQWLRKHEHQQLLANRQQVDYQTYRRLYAYPNPVDGQEHNIAAETTGPFRLAAINQHKRIYQAV